MTLEQIIEKEKTHRSASGMFGIDACKDAIRFDVKLRKCSLYEMLGKYVQMANDDVFFNRAMVLACWELINKQ